MVKLVQLTLPLEVEATKVPSPLAQEEAIIVAMATLLLQVLAAETSKELEDDRRS